MIEAMITLIIMLIGLLGIAGLQSKAQVAELEAYQRAQALIILSDIVDRMNANRATINCFDTTTSNVSGTPYIGAAGAGHAGAPACAASTASYNTQADTAILTIRNQLRGASETFGGTSVGAMIDARACISYDATTELGGVVGTGLYNVIVTWSGTGQLVAPVNMNCAVGLYGIAANRRAVSTVFRIANLFGS